MITYVSVCEWGEGERDGEGEKERGEEGERERKKERGREMFFKAIVSLLQIHLFSKDMLALLTTEDSGHYMLYTFYYYNQYPLTSQLV